MKAKPGSLIIALAISLGFNFASRADGDPNEAGPYRVVRAEYKFAATQDQDVLKDAKTELWARVFMPKNLNSPRPLLLFLHGNHGTCGTKTKTGTLDAGDCTYTEKGICPKNMVVIPNHEGYNYVAAHLASYGFIVASVNANRGITCGAGDENDFGLNLARGRLLLRHLQLWSNWATRGQAPKSLRVGPAGLIGKVDLNKIGLMGHSRGGEGIRAAYALLHDPGSRWPARMPQARIRALFEIGAVDGQTSRTLDANNVVWNQLLPMCDGDVSDLEGRLPFERMLLKKDEINPTAKSLYMVWGANHNFFNTEWQESDSSSCSGHKAIFGKGPYSAAQQKVARTAISAFFLGNLAAPSPINRAHVLNLFNPLHAVPAFAQGVTRFDRDFMPSFDRRYVFNVDSFNFPTGKSSYGIETNVSNVNVKNQKDVPNHAKLSWSTTHASFFQTNWSQLGLGYDISSLDSVDFRIARQANYLGSPRPTDFSVALVDNADRLSHPVAVSQYATVLGPVNETTVYQTIRIPLADFQLPAGKVGVRGVRFIFDRSAVGAVHLANVHFTGYYPSPLKLPATSGEFEIPTGQAAENKMEKPPIQYSASVVNIERKPGMAAPVAPVEITLHSPQKFRAMNQLLVLMIDDRPFRVSRYKDPSDLGTITFSITPEDFATLPAAASWHVQYGTRLADKIWVLPTFEKAELKD